MNVKQAAPLAVTLAPLIAAAPGLLIIGGLAALAVWLLSDDDKKPESASTPTAPERLRIPLPLIGNPPFPGNSGKIIPEKPQIPQHSAGILIPPRTASVTAAPAAPLPAVTAPAVPAVSKNPLPLPPLSTAPVAKIQPEIPQSARKKFISREDMAKILSNGRGLTRNAAVSALKALGFGKTAAYQALEINGRFAPWLQFASDGIITWKN